MLKLKDDVDLKELKKYQLKLEPERAFYSKNNEDNELFIWAVKDNTGYLKRGIYLQSQMDLVISNLDILYDLIKDGLVEKMED